VQSASKYYFTGKSKHVTKLIVAAGIGQGDILDDIEFMRMAVQAARQSISEDERIHPKVGVVVVREGKPPVASFRGELNHGEHAEYTALERKLESESLVGATIFTTLEPCTSRHHPKLPCVERLIERKVGKVFYGMVDPNPNISGRGLRRLREANIAVATFSPELSSEIEEMNREFIRAQRVSESTPRSMVDVRKNAERSLDDWYVVLNRTYWNQNYQRDASSIFTHLVEVVGGLSTLASNKKKNAIEPEAHIAKAFAWWLTLCGKLGVKSIEEMIWDKFPGVCTYCQLVPHNPDICSEKKKLSGGPPWETLASLGQGKDRPRRLRDWQRMFSTIYPAQQTEEYGPSFARLAEELGELAEAVRIFTSAPGYVLSEASDVFAWLMHIQNIVDTKNSVPLSKRGEALETAFARAYGDGCKECGKEKCVCPPILESTIGRIAHEVPTGRGSFESSGRFMTPDRASRYFQDS